MGLCAGRVTDVDFRVRASQHDGGSQCGCLFIFGPGRAKTAPHPIDSFVDLWCGVPECLQRPVIKIAYPDAGDWNSQAFKSAAERLAKKFTFSRMN